MAANELLKPTLHIEILLASNDPDLQVSNEICGAIASRVHDTYVAVAIGQAFTDFRDIPNADSIQSVEVVDYTGKVDPTGFYDIENAELDVKAYALKRSDTQRSIKQNAQESPPTRIMPLPNVDLHTAWKSLVFDDALPSRLLRALVRMISMMRQPGLDLTTFNWNRLCLLHGPPGSGKSTMSRALAQKLSIRLGSFFTRAILVEMNANALLSKFFGESGKLISSTFEDIFIMAQDHECLVCVMIDEIETIASSRKQSAGGNECADGLRATNQLLTAIDRLRSLPNVVMLCTSNLLEAIDPAFIDRVDIKQFVPCPSPRAVYNIFRSCMNELLRSDVIKPTSTATQTSVILDSQQTSSSITLRSSTPPADVTTWDSHSHESIQDLTTIVSFSEMRVREYTQPTSPSSRLWILAQKCEGFSGRSLRRLPILGLTTYTWGGEFSIDEAVSALEAAVSQELAALQGTKQESCVKPQ